MKEESKLIELFKKYPGIAARIRRSFAYHYDQIQREIESEVATIKIINQLLVNLMINNPDHLWTSIITVSTQDDEGIDALYKLITQNKKHILININIDDLSMYPMIINEPIPLSQENYLIEDITFSIYWD